MVGSAAGRQRRPYIPILVAALGYFVDIYDLILFSIVRVPSLTALGVSGGALLESGVLLLNMQMAGMLVGGIAWGVMGDRRGRLSVLFGSILLYSIANIANAFVQDVSTYAVLRFVAGVGLAGELGAGITLVSEILPKEVRGYGTTIVASVGVMGAVVAVLVGDAFDWRIAYMVGGAMGLALLVLRVGVFESGLFEGVKQTTVARGNFFALFANQARARRYLSVVLVGLPIWYVIGILITFAPEIGTAVGVTPAPRAARAVLFAYLGLTAGDMASGLLSQWMGSRKRALGLFLGMTTACILVYFAPFAKSLGLFYAICFGLGVSIGYWAVFVTVASEQFGTNLRATATTTAPNFVRGAVVPVTLLFQALRAPLGISLAGLTVGLLTVTIAAVALWGLDETFGRDLDFVED
ncbi:MAG: MFS transporter [Vicinamibacteria bacterium]|nr:MFS transporter [Vicinamibacteria bacterium]